MPLFKKKPTADFSYPGENPATSFINGSVEAMKKVQEIHVNTWHLNSPDSRWEVDVNNEEITFIFPDKTIRADLQIIGSLHNGSFMWGWDHPSVPPRLAAAARLAKEWGEQNNQLDYINKLVEADIEKAWEFTEVAARLAKASGTYSGETGQARIFMAFGPLTIKPR